MQKSSPDLEVTNDYVCSQTVIKSTKDGKIETITEFESQDIENTSHEKSIAAQQASISQKSGKVSTKDDMA